MKYEIETTMIDAPGEPSDGGIKAVLTVKSDGRITEVYEREYWDTSDYALSHDYVASDFMGFIFDFEGE